MTNNQSPNFYVLQASKYNSKSKNMQSANLT